MCLCTSVHEKCNAAPLVMLALLLPGAANCSSMIFRTSGKVIDLFLIFELRITLFLPCRTAARKNWAIAISADLYSCDHHCSAFLHRSLQRSAFSR